MKIGLHFAYSVVNQAWLLYWFDTLLGIYDNKANMLADYNYYLR